ncbi:MAG: YraN family protein [Candidatus Dojkabacteria bacterium]|uniref:UPF0102 protein H3C67_04620 n=2 Tax=Candidatus Dojkabacteria TaxID=74243 RepID=A0A952AL55_9BACT|nr:YraN family protein [Candidatus Dojkabacteria bacterium]WKZ27783.1 MAG: YraN family protein [Candidatus Dojkabacteria bacterium]
MTNTRAKGARAETLARDYIISLGYKIIERNYTIRGGEIDIIASDSNTIVFFEVKSLIQSSRYQIEEQVTQEKKKVLIRTCKYWLLKAGKLDSNWRIDFIGIVYKNNRTDYKLQHITNAIY